MEGSFVTVYPPLLVQSTYYNFIIDGVFLFQSHLDYLGSNDKGSSFICPVYMAKQYEIDNHKATTLSMSSDYDSKLKNNK